MAPIRQGSDDHERWSMRVAADHHDAAFMQRDARDHGDWHRREVGLVAATRISAGGFQVAFPAEPARKVWRMALLLQLDGDCVVEHDGRERRLAAGGWTWIDPALPCRIASSGLTQLLLELPRRGMPPGLMGRLRAAAPGQACGFNEALAATAGALAGRLQALDDEAFQSAVTATAALAGLGAGVVLPALPAAAETRLLRAAMACIAGGAADPRLDAARVAATVGVSRRRLDALFGWRRETISSAIRDARLRLAAHMLADPGMDTHDLTGIGMRAGFAEQSGFSRQFRSRYGCAPREFRERAAAGDYSNRS